MPDMLLQFTIGFILIAITVILHAITTDLLLPRIQGIKRMLRGNMRAFRSAFALVVIAAIIFGVMIIDIWLWALFYISVEALPDFETALYFSTCTFTTVGYGDIVLDSKWRLLSSFEAANGFLIFGWSTALIFEVVYKIYGSESTRH